MSAGKKYKFQGSTVAVLTGYVGGSPLLDITGITKADPAVVSVANHGLTDGDVVYISEVLGMTEVNSDLYIVNVLTSGTFELVGVDSTGYGTYTSGGKINEGTLSNFCELTNYNRQGGTSPQIPATTICSTAQENEVGLPDFGTTQFDFNFAPRTTIQAAIEAAYRAGTKIAVHVTLPNAGGEMVQLGTVQQTSEQAGVGTLWTGSITILNTGERYDVAA